METIDIVIPVLNEEASLVGFCDRLLKLPLQVRPIFVDNASTDKSCQIIQDIPGAVLIQHEKNEGYGASLRDGIRFASSNKIIIIDADGEYPLESIPGILSALDRHEVVYGSRFANGQQPVMRWSRRTGNKVITALFNLLFNQKLTDLYTGCKGFQRHVIQNLPMHYNGFEHVLEVASRLARNGISIHEVPVTYQKRKMGLSKMVYFALTIRSSRDKFS